MCRTIGLLCGGCPRGPPSIGKDVDVDTLGGLRVLLLLMLPGRVAVSAGEVERGVGGAVGIGVLVGSAIGDVFTQWVIKYYDCGNRNQIKKRKEEGWVSR